MQPAHVPASAAQALSMLTAAFDHLAAADWPVAGCQAQGEVLAGLRGAQARLTAVQARVLAAFTAARGFEPDGHGSARQWLIGKTGVAKGAAILLEAAAGGCPLEDLAVLAQAIYETWKAQHPDPDDGNGGNGDEDGFEDRHLRLGTTFGGAGKLNGDLTAHCAAALQAIFDSLGKHLGPGDLRTVEQRQHDALAEAMQRLIKADLLPESAGQATMAQVVIPFAALRAMPGASALEQEWIAAQAGRPGWLSGIGAEAAACDAAVAPVVTGTVDWQAADAMADAWIDAYRLERRRGCTCGGCTCQPAEPMTAEAKARLRNTLLGMAADAMSGPGGLAGYLRTRLLQVPYSAASLPLDVGRTKDIPDHLRRAVILRDRHCAWPGCDKPPAACECHHLVPRSQGGTTSLGNLKLLCDYHH